MIGAYQLVPLPEKEGTALHNFCVSLLVALCELREGFQWVTDAEGTRVIFAGEEAGDDPSNVMIWPDCDAIDGLRDALGERGPIVDADWTCDLHIAIDGACFPINLRVSRSGVDAPVLECDLRRVPGKVRTRQRLWAGFPQSTGKRWSHRGREVVYKRSHNGVAAWANRLFHSMGSSKCTPSIQAGARL